MGDPASVLFTVTNIGDEDANGIALSGLATPLSIDNTAADACPATLPGGEDCTVTVVFAPTSLADSVTDELLLDYDENISSDSLSATINATASANLALGTIAYLSPTDISDEESAIGTQTYTVTRTIDTASETAQAATTTVTPSGTADTDDYTITTTDSDISIGTDGTVTINWGSGDLADKVFSVTVVDDDEPEADESLTLTLSSSALFSEAKLNRSGLKPPQDKTTVPSLAAATATEVTIEILNDDVAPEPATLTIAPSSLALTANVGSQAFGEFTVSNIGEEDASGITITSLSDPLTINSALEEACGASLPAGDSCTIEIIYSPQDASDAVSTSISVDYAENTGAEIDLSITASPTFTGTEGIIAIVNPVDTSGAEDSLGTVNITVSRDINAETETADEITIELLLTGTADDNDYTASSADAGVTTGEGISITWQAGETGEKTFSIEINPDTDVEPDETLNIALFATAKRSGLKPVSLNAAPPLGAATANDVTITILNDDSAVTPTELAVNTTSITLNTDAGTQTDASVTLTNVGGQPATNISVSTLGAPLAVDDSDCADSLAAGASCDIDITYSPVNGSDNVSTDLLIDYDENPLSSALSVAIDATTQSNAVAGTFSIADASAVSGNENDLNTIDITIIRSVDNPESEAPTSITLSLDFAGSANGSDFNVDSSDSGFSADEGFSLTWNAGETGPKTIGVIISDDATTEPDETIEFSTTTPTGVLSRQITILNDDAGPSSLLASGSLVFPNDIVTGESQTTDFDITLQNNADESGNDITAIAFATVAPFAFDASDCPATLAAGATVNCEVSITFSPDGESAQNFSAPLTISFFNGIANDSTTLNISGDSTLPASAGTIAFVGGQGGAFSEDAGTQTINVQRSGGSAGAVSVAIAFSGSASEGSDFNIISPAADAQGDRRLNWANGVDGLQTITLEFIGDAVIETDESLRLELQDAVLDGAAAELIGTPDSADFTLNDSTAPGQLQFTKADWEFNESDGTVQVLVARDTGNDGGLLVDYVINSGSAIEGQDFTDATDPIGTLSWATGDSTPQAININLLIDDDIDPSETFTITLQNARTAEDTGLGDGGIGAIANATVTIQDLTEPSTVSLATNSAIVDEGELIEIEVLRSGGDMIFAGDATVAYSVTSGSPNGATPGSDFSEIASGTLTWPAGDTSSRVIPVQTLADDQFNEEDELILVTISNPSPADNNQLGVSSAIVTIIDTTNAGQLAFAVPSINVSEDAGQVTVTVTRSAPAQGELSVSFNTEDDTASAPEDYTSTSGTLQFGNGVTEQTITIPINMTADIGDEQFLVNLFDATQGVAINGAQTVITIEDTSNPGTFSLASNTFIATESQQTIEIVVNRDGTDGPATIAFSLANASAVSPDDYTLSSPANGLLSWQDGESQKTIQIAIAQDTEIEPDETFSVSLDSVNNGGTFGEFQNAIVTITDTSDTGQILFSANEYSSAENDGSATITLVRSAIGDGPLIGPASVNYSVSNGSASGGEDFTATSGTLSWGNGESGERSFSIDLLTDALIEGAESAVINLDSPAPATVAIDSPATLTITDSTTAEPVILSFAGPSSQIVTEDIGTVTFSLTRSGDSQSIVTLPFTVGLDDDTASSADFEALGGALVWQSGDTGEQTISIAINDDNVIELNETLSVQLGTATIAWPASLIDPPSTPLVQMPADNIEIDIRDNESRGLLGGDDTPLQPVYALEILSGDDQQARPPELLDPLTVRVVDLTGTQSIPAADVTWTIVPDPASPTPDVAELVDENGQALGTTTRTVANADGVTQISVRVLRRGFIGVRASPTVNVVSQAAKRQPLIAAPEVPSREGDVVFNIRAGLQPTDDLTENQARIARSIDISCDAIENAEVTPEQTFAAQDFLTLCSLEDESAEEIRAALQRLMPEEIFTFGDAIIDVADIQVTNVYSRINAIRSGRQAGVDASGLQLKLFGENIPGNVTGAAVDELLSGGGAAGSELLSNWGFFVNGAASVGKADSTENEVGQDFDTRGLTAGVDYRLQDNMVVGGALGHTNHESRFTADGGKSSLDGSYLTLFGTWYQSGAGYVDGVLEIGQNSFDIRRRINLDLTNPVADSPLVNTDTEQFGIGSTSADSIALTLGAGWNFDFEGLLFGPYGRLSHTSADVDAYRERASVPDAPGAGYVLDINSHRIRSTRLALGGQLSKNYNTSKGVFVPQFRLEAQFEAEDRPDGITATFLHDPTKTPFSVEADKNDRAVVNYGLGGSAVFANGKSAYFFYEGQAGHDTITQHWLKGGFRVEF